MNQLCVPVPTASDTSKILEEVFSLCRIPWIFDFIFYADPAADVSMLLAPIQKRHGLAARIFINATETSSKYAHTFDFNKELIFYSIPAFSVGAITAGFCVEQPVVRAGSTSSEPNSTNLLQCIRFVRDDNNGVFFHIAENHRSGITEVDCLTLRSSTRYTRVRMKFDLRSLRSVLRTTRGILHPKDTASSLIYLHLSHERRSCPVCGGRDNAECDCNLPLCRPTHPLDFRHESSNMRLYTGFYQGATVVRLCSAGHSVINATLQSGSVIQGELNAQLIARLHRMAVTDRLSRLKATIPAKDAGLSLAKLSADAHDTVAALEKQARSHLLMDAAAVADEDDISAGGEGVHDDRDKKAAVSASRKAAAAAVANMTAGDQGVDAVIDVASSAGDLSSGAITDVVHANLSNDVLTNVALPGLSSGATTDGALGGLSSSGGITDVVQDAPSSGMEMTNLDVEPAPPPFDSVNRGREDERNNHPVHSSGAIGACDALVVEGHNTLLDSMDGGSTIDAADGFFTKASGISSGEFPEASQLMYANDILGDIDRAPVPGLNSTDELTSSALMNDSGGANNSIANGENINNADVNMLDVNGDVPDSNDADGGSSSSACASSKEETGVFGNRESASTTQAPSMDAGAATTTSWLRPDDESDGLAETELLHAAASASASDGGDGDDTSQPSEPKRKRRRTTTPPSQVGCDSNSGKGNESVALSEAEKIEIRKKRNREAAARSNLKRKLKNESVRRDLASLTQRAIRLRVKEMMLRDENTRLRNALREAKVPFLPS